MLLYRSPRSASLSRFGVAIGLPKQPSWPKPVSSSTMNSTLGAPFGARTGADHAGEGLVGGILVQRHRAPLAYADRCRDHAVAALAPHHLDRVNALESQ